MQLLASTSKVLQGRALLRPHHDDRNKKNKKHAAVHLIRIAAAGPSASPNLQTEALAKQQD
jgi:hypothetical protein